MVYICSYLVGHCKTLKLLNCTLCPNVPRFWARELSGDLLALLYRLVTQELSAEELTEIQTRLQSDMYLSADTLQTD